MFKHIFSPAEYTYIGTIIVLILTFFVNKKKTKNVVLLITGIIAAVFTMKLADNQSVQEKIYKSKIDSLETSISNQVTGGGNIPVLKMTCWKGIYNHKPKKVGFMVIFDIANNEKTALNDIDFKIRDVDGYIVREFLDYDYTSDEFAFARQKKISKDEAWQRFYNYQYLRHIKRIPPKGGQNLFETGLPAQDVEYIYKSDGAMQFAYSPTIEWNGGTLTYNIKISVTNGMFKLAQVNVDLDGKIIKDIKKVFQFEYYRDRDGMLDPIWDFVRGFND